MDSNKLLNMGDLPSTIVKLPEGLIDHLKAFNERQWRRRVYVYHNCNLLPRPDDDYTLDCERFELILPWPLKSLDVITLAIPSNDERWIYVPQDGWGRL